MRGSGLFWFKGLKLLDLGFRALGFRVQGLDFEGLGLWRLGFISG